MNGNGPQIGIGLPAAIPGVPGNIVLAWAQRADAGPFSSLGLIDRIVYPNLETWTVLSAAAAVTSRIRLITTVMLAPLRNTGVLAKQAATLDVLSAGRLTLGLGVGARPDDFLAAPAEFEHRGRHLVRQLETMKRIWSGERLSDAVGPIGPPPVQPGGPPILLGGLTRAGARRIARWGEGYIAGTAGTPQVLREYLPLVRDAWQEAGRAGQPRVVCCLYYALGDEAAGEAGRFLRDYYGRLGAAAEDMVQGLPTTADAVRRAIDAYGDVGADEVIFWPGATTLDQVDRLAEIVG
jgi:alkanesulfonate monooxygenase SsuD/methylene tetrahydromethanopterin reductase-like flavin-dependent oxidoreductase (luciferase family)